jgi:hypothetical protein
VFDDSRPGRSTKVVVDTHQLTWEKYANVV